MPDLGKSFYLSEDGYNQGLFKSFQYFKERRGSPGPCFRSLGGEGPKAKGRGPKGAESGFTDHNYSTNCCLSVQDLARTVKHLQMEAARNVGRDCRLKLKMKLAWLSSKETQQSAIAAVVIISGIVPANIRTSFQGLPKTKGPNRGFLQNPVKPHPTLDPSRFRETLKETGNLTCLDPKLLQPVEDIVIDLLQVTLKRLESRCLLPRLQFAGRMSQKEAPVVGRSCARLLARSSLFLRPTKCPLPRRNPRAQASL